MQELTEEQKRIQDLQFHELPQLCMYGGYDDEQDFCETWLPMEKEFCIVDEHHEFKSEAKRKGSWHFYTGFCKMHIKDGIKHIKANADWHNLNLKAKNPQTVKIVNIWRVIPMSNKT